MPGIATHLTIVGLSLTQVQNVTWASFTVEARDILEGIDDITLEGLDCTLEWNPQNGFLSFTTPQFSGGIASFSDVVYDFVEHIDVDAFADYFDIGGPVHVMSDISDVNVTSGAGPTLRDVGRSDETDTSLTLGRKKLRAEGLTSETDSSLGLGRKKIRAEGLTSETDSSLSLGRVKVRAEGLSSETDTCLGLTKTKIRAEGLSSEADSCLGLGRIKIRAIGLCIEADSSLTLGEKKTRTVGLSTETDSSLGLGKQKVRTKGSSNETDSCLALGRIKILPIGICHEADSSISLFQYVTPFFDMSSEGMILDASSTTIQAASFSIVRTYGGPYVAVYGGMGAPTFTVDTIAFWLDLFWILKVFPNTVYGNLKYQSPAYIDYGDLSSDIVDPMILFNTYAGSLGVTFTAPTGSVDGIVQCDPVRSPPLPPPSPPAPDPLPAGIVGLFALPPGGFKRYDICVDYEIDASTIEAVFAYGIAPPLGPTFTTTLTVLGSRAVLVEHPEDWEPAPKLRWLYKTDIFSSDYFYEQRTSTMRARNGSERGEAKHLLTVNYKSNGLERSTEVYNRIARGKHRRFAVPWYFEPMIASVDLLGSTDAIIVNLSITDLCWDGYGPVNAEIVKLDRSNPSNFEVRRVSVFDPGFNRITVDNAWKKSVNPGSQALYFVRYCSLLSHKRTFDSDTHQTLTAVFASAD